MSFKNEKRYYIFSFMKINISYIFLLLIIINPQIIYSLIKIPFKIAKYQKLLNENLNKIVEDNSFNLKLLSFVNLGDPLQNIEVSFNLKLSNYFISNYCKNSSTYYSYKKSNTFREIKTIENPKDIVNNFYCNETFFFQDTNKNEQIPVNDMLIYMPKSDKNINNCLNIGLKFPNNINNQYQETFIQQLKHKGIISKYFWAMILYNNANNTSSDNYNKYNGEFIFGDIIKEYYPKLDTFFSNNKIVSVYTSKINKKNEENNKNLLEWGILFQVFYENKENNEIKNVIMNTFNSEFDFSINTIIGTYEYFQKIEKDFFSIYISKQICQTSYMGTMTYKFIFCNAEDFTINDLQKFPALNFKNKDLRFIYTLTYQDLFYLTPDKKYYVFNIIITNTYGSEDNEDEEQKWVLGLPFWKKYQFSFDIDNKLIYFYNKEGNFIDKSTHKSGNYEMQSISDEMENTNNDTNITNNQRIVIDNKKNTNEIAIDKLIFLTILGIFFFFLFCFVIFLVRKTLFKKGYVLMRIKKDNELKYDYYYTSENIDYEKKKNVLNKKELEMEIKLDN